MPKNPGTIDIAKVIEQKTGKRLPSFVAGLLRRLIHEREINEFIARHTGKEGKPYLDALHDDFRVTVRWSNPERLPQSGRCLFVSNHPLGAFDGVGISRLLYEQYGDARYIVNDMLLNLEGLRSIFVPVNTYGKQSRQHLEQLKSILQTDVPVGSFPAGWCSRYFDGMVQDRPWQKSFISLAIQSQRDVVPLHFVGKNSWHFYAIDRLRRAIGLKFDIATALLPDEMYRAQGKSFEVCVGEPISWQKLEDMSGTDYDKAQWVRSESYRLAPDNKEDK